jgi:hypothetical protein
MQRVTTAQQQTDSQHRSQKHRTETPIEIKVTDKNNERVPTPFIQ